MAEPMDTDDFEYAWRVIRHRCGDGIVDLVVPASAFEQIVAVLHTLTERVASLTTLAAGDEVEAAAKDAAPRRRRASKTEV
jgi:hypothetical protein